MTTIVLVHPTEDCPRYQVLSVYDSPPNVHCELAIQELSDGAAAERLARQLMESFAADHFRRVIKAHSPLSENKPSSL